MKTFLLAFLVMLLAVGGLAAGVLMGRKPLRGSCGGLSSMGLECSAGCENPCAKRQQRLDAEKTAAASEQAPPTETPSGQQ